MLPILAAGQEVVINYPIFFISAIATTLGLGFIGWLISGRQDAIDEREREVHHDRFMRFWQRDKLLHGRPDLIKRLGPLPTHPYCDGCCGKHKPIEHTQPNTGRRYCAACVRSNFPAIDLEIDRSKKMTTM